MQDQLTNSLQQPRTDVQQSTAQQPQQSTTPGVSDQVSPLLSEPAPTGELMVQQSVGSPDSSVAPVDPVSGEGYGWVLVFVVLSIVLVAWFFVIKASEVVNQEPAEELEPEDDLKIKPKPKPAKKNQSRSKRKKTHKHK